MKHTGVQCGQVGARELDVRQGEVREVKRVLLCGSGHLSTRSCSREPRAGKDAREREAPDFGHYIIELVPVLLHIEGWKMDKGLGRWREMGDNRLQMGGKRRALAGSFLCGTAFAMGFFFYLFLQRIRAHELLEIEQNLFYLRVFERLSGVGILDYFSNEIRCRSALLLFKQRNHLSIGELFPSLVFLAIIFAEEDIELIELIDGIVLALDELLHLLIKLKLGRRALHLDLRSLLCDGRLACCPALFEEVRESPERIERFFTSF